MHWRLYKYLPERHGAACRVICRGSGPGPRNELIEFQADGARVVAPRYSVQRAKPKVNAARKMVAMAKWAAWMVACGKKGGK